MDNEPNLDDTLAAWQQNLLLMEEAVQATDWSAARRLIARNSALFDRLKALLPLGSAVAGQRQRALQEGTEALRRLTTLFEAWQADTRTRLHGRQRARQTALAYKPVAANSPQHLRIYAGNPSGHSVGH